MAKISITTHYRFVSAGTVSTLLIIVIKIILKKETSKNVKKEHKFSKYYFLENSCKTTLYIHVIFITINTIFHFPCNNKQLIALAEKEKQ